MCFLRVRSFGMFRIRIYVYIYILDLDHGASNDESILDKESLVSWMTDDPSDPGSLILIGILPKKSILSQRGNFLCRCQPMEEIIFSCFKNQEQNQSNWIFIE